MARNIDIKIEDSDQPKDKAIWSILSDGFDIGELNAYMLTYDAAVEMCHIAYDEGERNSFTIFVPEQYKTTKDIRSDYESI